jgi:hypothetical protein
MHRVAMQTVSALSDPVMLLAGAALLALLVAAVVQLVRRRWRPAAGLACAAGALVAVYGATLVGVGLTSPRVTLAAREAKCFDDWCAALVGVHPGAGTLLVDVELQNRGRGRALRSDLARAYLDVAGRQIAPEDGRALQMLLQPGERADVTLTFASAGASAARFVVTESSGGPGPGLFEIGGEGSPFHPVAGWPVAPAGGTT